MRVSRLYVDLPLAPERTVEVDGDRAHYASRVLRLRPGTPMVLFNGDGADYAGEVANLGRGRLEVAVHARLPAAAEAGLRVTLAQAVGKGDRMDTALQKATELGAVAFQPLWTERTDVRLDGERLERRLAHWRGVIVSACEQSGRARVPDLAAPLAFREWLAVADAPRCRVLDPDAEEGLGHRPVRAGDALTLAIGPEGGFSEAEGAAARAAGMVPVRLGTRVLRTETAGPAALAALLALAGEF